MAQRCVVPNDGRIVPALRGDRRLGSRALGNHHRHRVEPFGPCCSPGCWSMAGLRVSSHSLVNDAGNARPPGYTIGFDNGFFVWRELPHLYLGKPTMAPDKVHIRLHDASLEPRTWTSVDATTGGNGADERRLSRRDGLALMLFRWVLLAVGVAIGVKFYDPTDGVSSRVDRGRADRRPRLR